MCPAAAVVARSSAGVFQGVGLRYRRHAVEGRLPGLQGRHGQLPGPPAPGRTRCDYQREVNRHVSALVHTVRSGRVLPAAIGNLTPGDVQERPRRFRSRIRGGVVPPPRRASRAVQAALAAGLPRRPRIRGLPHGHVSWLIAADIPLPVIRARLGHESVRTNGRPLRASHPVPGLGGQRGRPSRMVRSDPERGLRPVPA